MVDPTGLLSMLWGYVCCQREENSNLQVNLDNNLKTQIRKVANDSVKNGQTVKPTNAKNMQARV